MSLAGTTRLSQKGSPVIKDRAPANRSVPPATAQPDVFAQADVFATQDPKASPDVFAQRARVPSSNQPCSLSPRGAAAIRRCARPGGDPGFGRRGALRVVDRRRHADLGRQCRRRAQAARAATRSRPGAATPRLLDAETAQARFDAVMNSTARDEGAGVPYQVQYSLTPARRAGQALDRGHRPLVRRRATASRRARTASSTSSTSGTRRKRSFPTCRISMASPAR